MNFSAFLPIGENSANLASTLRPSPNLEKFHSIFFQFFLHIGSGISWMLEEQLFWTSVRVLLPYPDWIRIVLDTHRGWMVALPSATSTHTFRLMSPGPRCLTSCDGTGNPVVDRERLLHPLRRSHCLRTPIYLEPNLPRMHSSQPPTGHTSVPMIPT